MNNHTNRTKKSYKTFVVAFAGTKINNEQINK